MKPMKRLAGCSAVFRNNKRIKEEPTNDDDEMPPPGLYVVSLLHGCEEYCDPEVIGVYTTQEKALENARAAFESRRDESIQDELVGYEDHSSSYLRMLEHEGNQRVFLEYVTDVHLVVVAINRITQVDAIVHEPVPLIRNGHDVRSNEDTATTADVSLVPGNKIYVLMGGPVFSSDGDQGDPSLLGIFSTKQGAIDAAKAEVGLGVHNDDAPRLDDNTDTVGDRGFLIGDFGPFLSVDSAMPIAMNTYVIDEPFVDESDGRYLMQLHSDGTYWQPSPDDFDEIESDEDRANIPYPQKASNSPTKPQASNEGSKDNTKQPTETKTPVQSTKPERSTPRDTHPCFCAVVKGKIVFQCKTCVQREQAHLNRPQRSNETPGWNSSYRHDEPVIRIPAYRQNETIKTGGKENRNNKKKTPKRVYTCCVCMVDKASSQFSNSQWKQREDSRKCKTCVKWAENLEIPIPCYK